MGAVGRDTIARYLVGMNPRRCLLLWSLPLLFLAACQSHKEVVLVSAEDAAQASPALAVSESTRGAASALLAVLTDEQKMLALHDIKAPLRKDWHFVPRDRKGLHFGDMTNEQKKLVHKLMQTALSDSGYLKATDIIWLETVLYEMSNQAPFRSPNNYVIQIFGDPTDEKAAWGWRLEGHHLSLNLTYTPEGIGVTPLFFGTNPAVVQQGPLAGKRVLADAHNLAVELAKSMNDEQREKMMLDKKPREVITGPGREETQIKPSGIAMPELRSDQKVLLIFLIKSHIRNFDHDHTEAILDNITLRATRGASWDQTMVDTRFSWAGPIDADEPFYYRIYNNRFVIEYSCQGKNHVHAVMHDLTDPLQEDLLKKHFEQHEH
jgi:hypothetical protein